MLGRRAAIIGLIGGLSGCGFRPMMMESNKDSVRDDLAAVEAGPLPAELHAEITRRVTAVIE